ncbi:hypothetical protein Vadar_017721 [Vaccinium darrowii]|uniref:Uncharacterized protein n=1 Tax=Vaccinium darrowii TaxID=229202 RepID=A0ACB7X1Z4_9ERIC|nr:hypothetical protein Vadar_017721 [Vaccinium darrowii]
MEKVVDDGNIRPATVVPAGTLGGDTGIVGEPSTVLPGKGLSVQGDSSVGIMDKAATVCCSVASEDLGGRPFGFTDKVGGTTSLGDGVSASPRTGAKTSLPPMSRIQICDQAAIDEIVDVYDSLSCLSETKQYDVDDGHDHGLVDDFLLDKELAGSPMVPKAGRRGRKKGGEAKIRPSNLSSVTTRCFPVNWQCVHDAGIWPVARILLGWDPSKLSVSVLSCSDQMIAVSVTILAEHKVFSIFVIYGKNLAHDRLPLWFELCSLFPLLGSTAWALMGDFNVVRKPEERVSGFDAAATTDFNDCLDNLNMEDMVTKGFWFTWTNKRGGLGDNKSRLDRVLINNEWVDLFSDSEVVGHAPGVSDHCALVLTVLPKKFKACPFRFYNFWMADSRFQDLLISAWSQEVGGNPLTRLNLKLKGFKPLCKELHRKSYSMISARVLAARENLAKVQKLCFKFTQDQFLSDPEKDLSQQFFALSSAEESYKKQKSRVHWLALGDKNTKFFHQKMNAHKVRNTILSLVNAQGIRLERPKDIEAEILGYYRNLLGTEFNLRRDASTELSAAIQRKVPPEMREGKRQVRISMPKLQRCYQYAKGAWISVRAAHWDIGGQLIEGSGH